MATKSISKSVSVSGQEQISKFLDAIDMAQKIKEPVTHVPHTTASGEDLQKLFRSFRQ